jgi:hypothetical protein
MTMNDRLSGATGNASVTGTTAGQPSLASLVSGIVADMEQLVRQQIQLARTEVKQEWEKAKTAVGTLMAGAVLLTVGGVLLCFLLVHLINSFGVSLWGSFGIVGGVLVLCGTVLAALGYSQASRVNLVPPQTAQTLKENVQWIKSRT